MRPATRLVAPAALICTLSLAAMPAAAQASASTGTVAGSVIATGDGSITIQTSGKSSGTIDSMTAYATRLGKRDYPYVYGGGHTHAQQPSNGGKGHAIGYDCSGAVAAVLASGGLWPKGSSVPSDVGMIQELRARGAVLSGAGTGPDEVTLYDVPGHIYMSLAGRFYGTSGDTKGGPGWLPGNQAGKGETIVHFKSSLIKNTGSYPGQVTFLAGNSGADQLMVDGLDSGVPVQISYKQGQYGNLTLTGVTYPDATTATGVLGEMSEKGTSLQVITSGGQTLTLVSPPWPYTGSFLSKDGTYPLTQTDNLYIGQTVAVTYNTTHSGELVLNAIEVTSTPPKDTVTGIISSESSTEPTFSIVNTTNQTMTFTYEHFTNTLQSQLDPFSGIPAGCPVTVTYLDSPDSLPLSMVSYTPLKSFTPPAGMNRPAGVPLYTGCGE
jgi:hypothetical protein